MPGPSMNLASVSLPVMEEFPTVKLEFALLWPRGAASRLAWSLCCLAVSQILVFQSWSNSYKLEAMLEISSEFSRIKQTLDVVEESCA